MVETAEEIEQRGLSGPRGTDQSDELAGGDFEIDVFERGDCYAVLTVNPGQFFGADVVHRALLASLLQVCKREYIRWQRCIERHFLECENRPVLRLLHRLHLQIGRASCRERV